ncbi:MAG: radical SAM protein [bacterium]|nr:MAG: radical SAM protein [bacterium]
MPPRFLLINPWVYDFAAVDLWARPLGLYRVAEYLSRFDARSHLLDLMDVHVREKTHGRGKYPRTVVPKPEFLAGIPRHFARYGRPETSLTEALRAAGPFDALLITGIMTYWYPGIVRTVDIVRRSHPRVPIILGGVYPTLWQEHASSLPGVDAVFTGILDDRFLSLLGRFDIRLDPVRDDPLPWYDLSSLSSVSLTAAPLMTGLGCPFQCPYCAVGPLTGGVYRRDPDSVVNEVLHLASRGVRDFAFYDDALLYRPEYHIKPILREIERRNRGLRFHTPNGLHARFIDDELAGLMRSAGFTTLRLSLETVNEDRQRESGKVFSRDLRKAVISLRRAGFRKEEMGVYLMYGLPGQDLQEVSEGVDFVAGLGARVNLTEFSPIPGTSHWRDLVSSGVISDDIDPLMTNNTVFSVLFSGYDPERLEALKKRVRQFNGQEL